MLSSSSPVRACSCACASSFSFAMSRILLMVSVSPVTAAIAAVMPAPHLLKAPFARLSQPSACLPSVLRLRSSARHLSISVRYLFHSAVPRGRAFICRVICLMARLMSLIDAPERLLMTLFTSKAARSTLRISRSVWLSADVMRFIPLVSPACVAASSCRLRSCAFLRSPSSSCCAFFPLTERSTVALSFIAIS